MPTIRTGDWGSLGEDDDGVLRQHLWFVEANGGIFRPVAHALCGSMVIMPSASPMRLGEPCQKCREIIERAAREVPGCRE